jgi:ABC-type amino acid transport substrate-binding protein
MIVKRGALAIALGLALLGAGPFGVSKGHTSVICLDSSSPSFALDRKIVAALSAAGEPITPFVYDGGEGVSERFFRYLSRTKCGLIMGFPVDLANPDPPDGLALTHPYLSTAYVLVSRTKTTQAALKSGMTIAVGMGTAPHFYLAGAFGATPNFVTNTYQTQEQVLDALGAHQAQAAMVWEPSLVRYERSHPGARSWYTASLHMQHSRWKMAALYPEDDTASAARFNAALHRLEDSGELASLTKAYTWEQTDR